MNKQFLLLFVILPLGIFSLFTHLSAQNDLSSELKLKVQIQQRDEKIFSLQASLAQCQITSAEYKAKADESELNKQSSTLQNKHKEIEIEILKSLNAKDGEELDWDTLTIKAKK